eukprot:snap_masked-scaffold_10-processed-gene-5.32-mRNA-1 protein AED:1.00 eAED:1.00 QI:0/-1/0/0/-1/1/1/0/237
MLTLMMSIKEFRKRIDRRGLTFDYLNLIYFYLIEMEQSVDVGFAHTVEFTQKVLYFLKTFECIVSQNKFIKKAALDNPAIEFKPTEKSERQDTSRVPASMASQAKFVAKSNNKIEAIRSALPSSFFTNTTLFARQMEKEPVELKDIRTTINMCGFNRFNEVNKYFKVVYEEVDGWRGLHEQLTATFRRKCNGNLPDLSKVSIKQAIEGFLQAAALKKVPEIDSHLHPETLKHTKYNT